MRNGILFTLLTLSSLGAAGNAVAEIPGPREPLTFRNSALYCGWNDYLVRADSPFDFLLVQGNGPFEGRDNAPWNEWLKKARKNGKRVIALLNPQVKKANGEFYNISTCPSDEASLDGLVRVMSEFLDQVDVNELYAVSLSEEHIFWNGEAERLNVLYDKLKAKYKVPVYQWYSPSGEGSVPGLNWPNLKADGWLTSMFWTSPTWNGRCEATRCCKNRSSKRSGPGATRRRCRSCRRASGGKSMSAGSTTFRRRTSPGMGPVTLGASPRPRPRVSNGHSTRPFRRRHERSRRSRSIPVLGILSPG